jgi:hypothetical protein
VHEGLAPVGARPAMEVGDPSSPADVSAVVLEALCLAIDEHTGGRGALHAGDLRGPPAVPVSYRSTQRTMASASGTAQVLPRNHRDAE